MKKLVLSTLIIFMHIFIINAQTGIRVGLNVGLPARETSEIMTLNAGVDFSYLGYAGDDWNVGIAGGYTHFLAETNADTDTSDLSFIPIAGSVRYRFSDVVFGSVDLGYALAVQGDESGVYYQPKIGWNNERIDIFTFYKGVQLKLQHLRTIGIGFAYNLFPSK